MPKAERGTPKDIAKRIKAKGLQKLKFWCQVCHKQCRDANGFQCHLTSESHLRQIKLFSEHASQQLDQYSRDFERTFLETLRRRHGGSANWVSANHVYQQVIQDKEHTHMNATMWTTLTDFVKYLGKTGKCLVQENVAQGGWSIQYIERDASQLARQEALLKRQEADARAEQALQERIQKQRREQAALQDEGEEVPQATSIGGSDGLPTGTISLDWKANQQPKKMAPSLSAIVMDAPPTKKRKKSVFDDDDDDEPDNNDADPAARPSPPALSPNLIAPSTQSPRKAAHEEKDNSMSTVENTTNATTNWLHEGIVVRIIDETSRWFRQKVIVEEVLDQAARVVPLPATTNKKDKKQKQQYDNDEKHAMIVSVHQLETVVPKATGEMVRIVMGPYQGRRAKVVELNKHTCQATLKLKKSKHDKKNHHHHSSSSSSSVLLEQVDFDHFSKIAEAYE